ncbi:hypothetical protein CVIRNUC_001604 [Coccomyxa viridis]|uniref:Nudix hydrolase domain-containing protein n=1 Tax=Coccomyxa viridis TaxID=1274662 RepID=A0AAV1HUI9_9CHLO|nr:hypothetical protein CVIRNUC_001604 [Coccomyxa viridis]
MSLQGYQRWLDTCNSGLKVQHLYHQLRIGSTPCGFIQPWLFQRLRRDFPSIFQVEQGDEQIESLALSDKLDTADKRSSALAGVLQELREDGALTGWRSESYPLLTSFHAEPLALVERAAAVHLGIKAYGVHVNGYVRGPSGIELWVATRSKNKPTWPGRLDHIVAGGQPHGLSPQENVIKECEEEASIPRELAQLAVPAGAVSYCSEQAEGLKRDVLFCYDLELPQDFVPEPQDGEVESFQRLPLKEVADTVARTDEFKDNCNLVIISFLVRHGFLKPELPGYLGIVSGLLSGDCS